MGDWQYTVEMDAGDPAVSATFDDASTAVRWAVSRLGADAAAVRAEDGVTPLVADRGPLTIFRIGRTGDGSDPDWSMTGRARA